MPTYPYLSRSPKHLSTYSADELIERLFPDKNYGTRVPANVHTEGWVSVDGVNVCYLTPDGAREFWCGPDDTKGMYMRAIAQCPHPGCHWEGAASRINQHAIVHHQVEPPYVVSYWDETGITEMKVMNRRTRFYRTAYSMKKRLERMGFTVKIIDTRNEEV